jgi:hypothetical protein
MPPDFFRPPLFSSALRFEKPKSWSHEFDHLRPFGVGLALTDLFENGTVVAIAERIEEPSKGKSFESEAA